MSNNLAFDTSSPSLSVCLAVHGQMVEEHTEQTGQHHTERLLPLIDQMLTKAQLSIQDLSYIALTVGPGSFAGVRIGVALAQGLCMPHQTPVVAVNALEAMAYPFAGQGEVVVSLMDARRGQVYASAFENGKRVLPDQAVAMQALLAQLPEGCGCLFVGDGAIAYREQIVTALGVRARFAPMGALRATSVLALAATLPLMAACDLQPYYLRASQAEQAQSAHV